MKGSLISGDNLTKLWGIIFLRTERIVGLNLSRKGIYMNLHENMSTIQIRLMMKELGWSSKDDLTNDGWDEKYGYSLWFERWTWHGVRVGRICIHEHIPFESEGDIQKVTYKLAKKCIKAYEQFTEEVPWQMADGSLEEDPIQTPYYKEALDKGENKQELIDLLGALSVQI